MKRKQKITYNDKNYHYKSFRESFTYYHLENHSR